MWAAILAAFQAIPSLIKLGEQLVGAVSALVDQIKEQQIEKWIQAGRDTERKLTQAKTDAERQAILHELQKLRGNMPT